MSVELKLNGKLSTAPVMDRRNKQIQIMFKGNQFGPVEEDRFGKISTSVWIPEKYQKVFDIHPWGNWEELEDWEELKLLRRKFHFDGKETPILNLKFKVMDDEFQCESNVKKLSDLVFKKNAEISVTASVNAYFDEPNKRYGLYLVVDKVTFA